MKNDARMDGIWVGSLWTDGTCPLPARVMATVEGYVVARFKGCMPFVKHHKDWRQRFALMAVKVTDSERAS